MDWRSPEDDFPRTFPEVELPSEFPNEFPAASATDKAAIYRVTTQVESPTSGKTATYRATIQVIQLRTKRRSLRAPRSCTPAEFKEKKSGKEARYEPYETANKFEKAEGHYIEGGGPLRVEQDPSRTSRRSRTRAVRPACRTRGRHEAATSESARATRQSPGRRRSSRPRT